MRIDKHKQKIINRATRYFTSPTHLCTILKHVRVYHSHIFKRYILKKVYHSQLWPYHNISLLSQYNVLQIQDYGW